MIDTQKLQEAPKCISGVAEVAATLARADQAQCTHAIEVTTCFPLDIETVGRMLEGLGERAGIDMIQSDGVCYLNFERPDDYNDLVLRRNRLTTAALAGTGVAVVSFGIASYFFLRDGKSEPPSEANLQFAPTFAPGEAGAMLHWRF